MPSNLPHNENYVVSLFLYNQSQPLNFSPVLGSGGHDVDAGGVDAAVAQNVGQLGDVLFNAVEGAGEQLAEIVGKDLAGLHVGLLAQGFHLCPDIAPIQRPAASGDENRPTAGRPEIAAGFPQSKFFLPS